ncbi:FAD/NAD(P)-binding domain-containing protein [Fomitopsis serialis]|uniref:FAD/NAD(P)-binding domain-containing protein n=1 Tax=Fomitopsis serialis TaxID=139415 RepID=UPI002007F01F|nr:FAD/NAD(P)-binding domain-containing protein [Neoantrodia serialis]KAH9929152.1 FAD/NAD(P)-binding domain-containing protein [Neoantrodia serialis]
MPAKLRVAIIGAGIGGLTFAVALQKLCKDVEVVIYEAASHLAEIGAGVGLWQRPWKVIEELGLADSLLPLVNGNPMDGWQSLEYRKCDQPQGVSFCEGIPKAGFASLHRAKFQQFLFERVSQYHTVIFSKRLTSYTELQSKDILLNFRDGSSATCDLLVGCDGIKSTVRSVLYRSLAGEASAGGDEAEAAELRKHVEPVWSGTVAYRALIPMDALELVHPNHPATQRAMLCFGKNKHLVLYPLTRVNAINVVAFVSQPELEETIYEGPWVRSASREEVTSHYANWEPEVRSMLNCINEVSLWAISTVPSLPTYFSNGVCLLGDAAHAMTPHQGSGAGQAIEDGFILATLLTQPGVTRDTLPVALQVYDALRRPFSQNVVQLSRSSGMSYRLNCPGFEALTEEQSYTGTISPAQLDEVGKTVIELTSWNRDTSIMTDRDRALESLAAALRVV